MEFRLPRFDPRVRVLNAMRPRLMRVAYAWCNDREFAEDLVQETYLRALPSVRALKDDNALEVWMFRIMANCHVDFLRRRREVTGLEAAELPSHVDPEIEYERDALAARVKAAIGELNESQRKVLTLVDLMGFSYKEVASILEIPAGTVMSRLSRGREHLKSLLLDDRTSEPGKVTYLYK